MAFTVYTIQWIYYVIHFLYSLGVNYAPYKRLPWMGTLIVAFFSLTIFHLLLIIWSKCGYVGSVEWLIVNILNRMTVVKKQVGKKIKTWSKLNVEDIFQNPDWECFDVPNIDEKDETFIKYLSIFGFIFTPFSMLSLWLLQDFESENKTTFKIMNIISILLFIIFIITANFITPNDIGLYF